MAGAAGGERVVGAAIPRAGRRLGRRRSISGGSVLDRRRRSRTRQPRRAIVRLLHRRRPRGARRFGSGTRSVVGSTNCDRQSSSCPPTRRCCNAGSSELAGNESSTTTYNCCSSARWNGPARRTPWNQPRAGQRPATTQAHRPTRLCPATSAGVFSCRRRVPASTSRPARSHVWIYGT